MIAEVARSLKVKDAKNARRLWIEYIESLSKVAVQPPQKDDVHRLVWQVLAEAYTDEIAALGISQDDLAAEISELEAELTSIDDDVQQATIDLQNMLEKQQQTLETMAAISKLLHDTAVAVIRKLG